MSVADTLAVIAPEFDALDPATRDAAIAIAESQIGANFCGGGSVRELAVAYLTAHTLTIRERSGNAGAVTSVREGDLSIGYGASGVSSPLGATSYGQEYERLKRQCLIGARNRMI